MSEPASAPATCFECGAGIVRQIDERRWALADWAASADYDAPSNGRALPDDFPLMLAQVRKAARLARAFPAADRDPALPYDVYLQLLRLPAEERVSQLATARAERWGVKRATAEATRHRVATAAFEDDDPERLATHVYRAWNNAPAAIRRHAWELLRGAAAAGFTLVDEENPVDA